MARLTIEVEDRLLADMNALARVRRLETADLAHAAITEYIREHSVVRSVKSVKVGSVGNSISVTAQQRQSASLAERKRLSERTFGLWKDRDVDGLKYQEEQRAE